MSLRRSDPTFTLAEAIAPITRSLAYGSALIWLNDARNNAPVSSGFMLKGGARRRCAVPGDVRMVQAARAAG